MFECYDSMTIDELKEELDDLNKAIDNEYIWGYGSHSAMDLNMHAQNMEDLRNRIDYINDLIKEREDNDEDLG